MSQLVLVGESRIGKSPIEAGDRTAIHHPQVNSVVTDALSNWTFQPSQVDGKAVALKVLMGVHLVAR